MTRHQTPGAADIGMKTLPIPATDRATIAVVMTAALTTNEVEVTTTVGGAIATTVVVMTWKEERLQQPRWQQWEQEWQHAEEGRCVRRDRVRGANQELRQRQSGTTG